MADSAERLGVPRNYSIAWLPVVSFALGIFPLPVQSNSLHSTSRDSFPKSNLCAFFEGSAKVPRLQANRHNQARVKGTRAYSSIEDWSLPCGRSLTLYGLHAPHEQDRAGSVVPNQEDEGPIDSKCCLAWRRPTQ